MRPRALLVTALSALAVAGTVHAGEGRGVAVVRTPGGDVLPGRNWLLLIAINDYREWPPLSGPCREARQLKEVLLSRYAFARGDVVELFDRKATKGGIIGALKRLRKRVAAEDTLLIYYAGHGHTDPDTGGHWIPHDGGRDMDKQTSWLPNQAILRVLKRMPCAHVLLVSDSCFSGDLLERTRGAPPRIDDEYFRRAYRKRSREVMTSGASEQVTDDSAFAFHLIDTLRRNRDPYLDPLRIFDHVRSGVKGQQPLLGSLKGAGHQEGGAYIFFLREGGARKTPVPAPPSGGLDLSDLTRQSETRKQWDAGLARMKADYREVERFATESTDGALNVKAWQRFVDTYTQDDPFSTEDEELRAKAKRELTRWRAEARRPRPQATSAGKTLTLDLGGGVAMELVLIPAGEFTMGSPNSEANRGSDEGPRHRVRITKPFYMGKYEVTQAQYEQIMGTNPSDFEGSSNPVEQVSRNDATEFCRKISQRTGRQVRLPTEAEWEYACRAGSTTRFCFGDSENSLRDYAWCNSPAESTHPVGGKRANAWGLHDMHGNVFEWCADRYGSGYYAKSPREDPTGPGSGSSGVNRGGCWRMVRDYCRSAYRSRCGPTFRYNFLGFRMVVSPSPGR